ncbi:RNA-binding protein [Phaeovulum sp. W22_SRMD_FR3]|uniref:RNA-binding protein n=1 Tax=Phaeovulum sp. W22_SRMD_FR3 TaxID=3240274 RepID=UPI003F9E9290
MTRGGQENDNEEPERRCIVTGEVQPKPGLIRFVLGPDAMIFPDLAHKLPGRGIWVTADREVLETAVSKNAFSRAARQPVKLPEGLPDLIEAALARRVVDLVSLARKSGRAVCGFEKVKDWLAQGRAKVLLQASDGSERGKGKLWTPEGGRWFGCLTASELGLAFGRDHAIHGALATGGLTKRVIVDAAKLTGMRKQDGGATAGKDTKTV